MRRGLALGALAAVIAIVAIVVVATMGSGTHAGPSAPSTPVQVQSAVGTIHGQGFSASAAAGWKLTVPARAGTDVRYQLSSTGAAIDSLGLPPAGTIGITIDAFPSVPARASETPIALLRHTVGTPRGAVGIASAGAPRAVRVAGAAAAEKALTYTYERFSNVQVDVIARHGRRTYLIELDAEPSLGAESRSALELLFSSWRWS